MCKRLACNSGVTRDSNHGRRVLIPSVLTTTPPSHTILVVIVVVVVVVVVVVAVPGVC